MNALEELYEVVMSRKAMYENGEVDVESQKSYTCYLFSKGQDNDELKNEIADLMYHIMVLCAQQGLPWSEVEAVLEERSQKIGNLKTFKNVDHNS